jgi:hypothetical protein
MRELPLSWGSKRSDDSHSHSVRARPRAGRGREAGVSEEEEDQVLLTHDRFAETWATVSSYTNLVQRREEQ